MTSYLLDTNHAGALFRELPQPAERLRLASDDEFILCLPSIGELWFMIFNSTRVQANRSDLERFLRGFRHIPYDLPAAMEFGRIKAELRKIGRPIPDVDVQIAAIARVNDLVLLSADTHFAVVSGLRTDNWLR